jgi:hypothetical protein
MVDLLEGRSYATYRARLEAAKRLTRRNHAWNALLVSFATSTTISSIALLVDGNVYGRYGSLLLVCLGVLSLVSSMTVTSLNYSGRAKDMFANYRKLQRLSAHLERIRLSGTDTDAEVVAKLSESYQELLDGSENHTSADFRRAGLSSRLGSTPGIAQDSPGAADGALPGPGLPNRRCTKFHKWCSAVARGWRRLTHFVGTTFSLTVLLTVIACALPAFLLIPVARMITGA